MVTIYLVRHCEAEGNALKIYQGCIDLDITEMGAKQLEKLEERFERVHIDRVYSSPLIRARKTAGAIANKKGLEIIDDEGLVELDGGDFEGMQFSKIFSDYADYEWLWQNAPQNFCAPNGETMRELYDRMWQTVLNISRENDGKTVAIASHGAAIRNLICKILYNDIERLNEVPWNENTAVTKFILDGENVKIEYTNDFSHLSEGIYRKISDWIT